MDIDYFSPELDAAISHGLLYVPELEPLELIWRKGPVEEPLRGLPGSIFEPQLAQPSEQEKELIEEDEMAAWLHYPIDTTDARTDLNRRTQSGSSKSVHSVLLGNATESDCQVGPVDIGIVCTEKAEASSQKRGVKSKGHPKNSFEGRNELNKRGSLIESKFSTITSDKKRKNTFHRSMSPRKARVTKTHNLSEQQRRSRINERMKTLQGLVPRSSKLDKASILDATIAHVKSLQKQLKMMAMGFPIRLPMIPSGAEHIQSMPVMPSMGMDMGLNMAAMGMRTGAPQFGLAMPYPHINQIQAPLLPCQQMAVGMFPYPHAGDPYHFPGAVLGQVSPEVNTALPCASLGVIVGVRISCDPKQDHRNLRFQLDDCGF